MVFRTKLDGLATRSTGDLTPCAAGSLLSRLLSGPHNSEKTSVFVPIKLQADPPFARASSSSRPACVSRLTSLVQSTHSPGGQATSFSMASTCYPPITDSYPYGSIFELGMQSSKPRASPGAQPLGFATSFNLSTVGELAPPMGQFLSSGRTANLSDDEGFPFLNYRAIRR